MNAWTFLDRKRLASLGDDCPAAVSDLGNQRAPRPASAADFWPQHLMTSRSRAVTFDGVDCRLTCKATTRFASN